MKKRIVSEIILSVAPCILTFSIGRLPSVLFSAVLELCTELSQVLIFFLRFFFPRIRVRGSNELHVRSIRVHPTRAESARPAVVSYGRSQTTS